MNLSAVPSEALWRYAAAVSACFVLFLALFLVALSAWWRQRRSLRAAVADSLDRSRSVLRGQVAEHFAPFLPGFPFNPKDARFLGQPVDYLVFDGLAASDGRDEVTVVLVEIKTGQSALTGREAALRRAVEAGRVRWLTLRMDGEGRLAPEL